MSAKAALAALKAQLATVYTTLTGRDALATTALTLPVLTLYSTRDVRAAAQNYDGETFTRQVTVELKITATTTYDQTLDDALVALRGVIKPHATTGIWWSGNALRVQETGVAFFGPDPNGDVAYLQMTLEFDYL